MKPAQDPIAQALNLLQLGAPASYLLLLLSLAALTLIIVKGWEFWELRLTDRSFISRALLLFHRGQPADALAILQDHRGPLPASMAAAVAAVTNPALTREQAVEFARVHASERLEDAR